MFNKNKINVLVTGGFDPLHSGHIKLFQEASLLGSKLFVGINSDEWLIRKKKYRFLPIIERKIIIENLKMVDKVVLWDDLDNTANGAIETVLKNIKDDEVLIFANGGDRKNTNTPEIEKHKNNSRVIFEFGVGGFKKTNSSSKILFNYKNNH